MTTDDLVKEFLQSHFEDEPELARKAYNLYKIFIKKGVKALEEEIRRMIDTETDTERSAQ